MEAVTVVIPQYGQPELTIACVRSLFQCHPELGRAIVVDDGSTSAEVRKLQYTGPGNSMRAPAEIVRLTKNAGVTAAWNAGLKEVATPLVVFLNNDTISTGPWLIRLVKPLAVQNPKRTGRAFPLMTAPALRHERFLPREMQYRLAGGRVLGGWCFAMRTAVLRELSGFDERFRLYFSDTDLQCRLILKNPDALCCTPGLPLLHLSHRTTRTDPRRSATWQADRHEFWKKWCRGSYLMSLRRAAMTAGESQKGLQGNRDRHS